MDAKIEARVSQRFKASAERVYDAWLDPQQIRSWMAAALKSFGLAGDIRRIEIDARIGGKFIFSDMRNADEARHWGTYLELERPQKIVFTWIVDEAEEAHPSKVTLSIHAAADSCVATLVHEMDPKWAEYVERTENGWRRMLAEVDALLT